MAGKGVKGQQRDVDDEHERAHTNKEMSFKPESLDRVIPKEAEKHDGGIEKVAMHVLQDERKASLAAIVAPCRFAYGAGRRIEKERPIVSLAVVVAGHAKTQRENQDEQRGRNDGRQPVVLGVDQRR